MEYNIPNVSQQPLTLQPPIFPILETTKNNWLWEDLTDDLIAENSVIEPDTCTLDKYFHCQDCPYKTAYKKCLVKHVATKCKRRMFVCDVCHKNLHRKSKLDTHYKCQHPVEYELRLMLRRSIKPHKCHICSHATKRKYDLKRHLKTHDKIKKNKHKPHSTLIMQINSPCKSVKSIEPAKLSEFQKSTQAETTTATSSPTTDIIDWVSTVIL
jgi:hypothetical protein